MIPHNTKQEAIRFGSPLLLYKFHFWQVAARHSMLHKPEQPPGCEDLGSESNAADASKNGI